jgi:hypothetical protein
VRRLWRYLSLVFRERSAWQAIAGHWRGETYMAWDQVRALEAKVRQLETRAAILESFLKSFPHLKGS